MWEGAGKLFENMKTYLYTVQPGILIVTKTHIKNRQKTENVILSQKYILFTKKLLVQELFDFSGKRYAVHSVHSI